MDSREPTGWKLFLDDVRALADVWPEWVMPPGPAGAPWRIARSYPEAIALMKDWGCPHFVSFDHDLGLDHYSGYNAVDAGYTGMDLAHWMVERDLDMQGSFFPEGFAFHVHSANPVGARNIQMFMDAYLASKG